mgnify:CR=1 FL=1
MNYTLSFKRNKVYLPFPCVAPSERIKQPIIAIGTHVEIVNLIDATRSEHPGVSSSQVKKQGVVFPMEDMLGKSIIMEDRIYVIFDLIAAGAYGWTKERNHIVSYSSQTLHGQNRFHDYPFRRTAPS